jgi:hypothetical protein
MPGEPRTGRGRASRERIVDHAAELVAERGVAGTSLNDVLTDGPLNGHVHASARFTMKTISRADVAWYILNLAGDSRPATSAPRSSPPPPEAQARPAGGRTLRHAASGQEAPRMRGTQRRSRRRIV